MTMMRKRYYRVTGQVTIPGRTKVELYSLGYTTNKQTFQRASGWKKKDLIFEVLYRKETWL